jgi:hypothetical protein
MQKFMNKLASKFIKPEVIPGLKASNASFSKLYISVANQKHDRDLFIGFTTKNTLQSLLEADIDDHDVDKFFDGVRAFYTTAYKYCVDWLPLDEVILKHSRFLDFDRRLEFSIDDVNEVVSCMPLIHRNIIGNVRLQDDVEEEFLIYQGMTKEEVRQSVWDDSLVYEKDEDEEKISYHRMDIIWAYLCQRLQTLSNIALSVLTIPHSNATEERIFSMITKNKTQFRASLDLGK